MVDPLARFEVIVVLTVYLDADFFGLRSDYLGYLGWLGIFGEERAVVFEGEDACFKDKLVVEVE
jgi:hypothetical protein